MKYSKKNFYHKKRRNFRSKKAHKKNDRYMANASLVKFYTNPRYQLPLPPRYQTTMYCDVQGTLAAGGMYNSYNAYWQANSLIENVSGTNGPYGTLPFNTGQYSNVKPTVTTLFPCGFKQLCNSNLYQNYRIYASKTVVTIVPGGAEQDPLMVNLGPAQFGTGTSYASFDNPYFKTASFNTNQGALRISNYMTTHKFFGVTKRAIQDDVSGNFIGEYNTHVNDDFTWLWQLNVYSMNGTPVNYQCGFLIQTSYYIELFDLNSPNMLS